MTRKFSLALAIVVIFVARGASAAVITPTDFSTLAPGVAVLGSLIGDPFDPAPPATTPVGSLLNTVYFDNSTLEYTYVHVVTPSQPESGLFNTGFSVSGFTGVAGWAFADSFAAGGCGGPAACGSPFGDFLIQTSSTGRLGWMAFDQFNGLWNAGEPILFFYRSTNAPREGGNYNLTGTSTGTAQSFAPVPEPGSIALLGTGLVVAYGAARRRRSGKR